jgi:eukaryotic-like serine/threonine-protein kinase
MARFQREAKVLASLNHPNIATIHGLEDPGGARVLAIELLTAQLSPIASSKGRFRPMRR